MNGGRQRPPRCRPAGAPDIDASLDAVATTVTVTGEPARSLVVTFTPLSPLIGTSRELARAVVGADGTVTVQFTVPATAYLLGRAHVAYLIDDAPAGDATRIW